MIKRPIYYDTETTGVSPGKDRIVEIAAFDPVQNRTFCSFINPECLIPPEATAISHITNEMVQDAPFAKQVLSEFATFCQGEDVVLVAHNNDAFDKVFLECEFKRAEIPFPDWLFVDTLKWARKYRFDLPRHSLQSLREVYGIEANQAHRALDDVMVLYKIFSIMVGDLSWETILKLMETRPRLGRMPFGKHAGKALAEVPKAYVAWLKENGALDKKENTALREAFETLGLLS